MTKNIIIPSSTADQKLIKDAVTEISGAMTRIEAEQGLIKEILSRVEEEVKLPKKFVSKLAKVYHNQSFDKEVADAEDFQELYQIITGDRE